MTVEPDERQLIASINREYRVEIDTLKLGPQGEDSFSWVGESHHGSRYFIRLQKNRPASLFETAMRATISLRQKARLWQVVAPFLTKRGRTVSKLDGYDVCVFPFIEGRRLSDIGVSGEDIAKIARLIARVHTTDTRSGFPRLRRETFANPFEENVRRIFLRAKSSSHPIDDDDYRRRVFRLVKAEKETITLALKEMRSLRTRILPIHPEQVLTHGDSNTANFIKDPHGRLFLTDWGDIGVGPPERDLFHFSGQSLGPFLKEYTRFRTRIRLSTEIFAFYYYRWALQEISDYCSRILDFPIGLRERKHAWRELQPYVPVQHRQISRQLGQIDGVLNSVLG